MYSAVKDQLDVRARRDPRRRPVQGRARHRHAAERATSRSGGDEVLNLCANNYLGLADHPALDRGRPARRSTAGATAWPRCASSAARRRSTRSSRRGCPRSSAPRTRSSTAPASTPTAACSRRCSAPRTRSSPTRSTTPRSSTASGSARPSATATRTATWPTSRQLLKETQGARRRLIATDGVFSMDGYLAKLDEICDLADRYDALVMVDDSHAVGFVGPRRPRHARAARRDGPRRHPHRHARQGAGRRLAAATPAAAREIVELLRQRSRPYLFSNTLAPPIAAASLKVLELLESGRRAARAPARQHRALPHAHDRAGFDILPGEHPIVPVMLGDAVLAGRIAEAMLERGVYVIGFSYPVVPRGPGAHPHADLGGALGRRHRPRDRRLRGGQNGGPGRLTRPTGHVTPSRSGRHIAGIGITSGPLGCCAITGASMTAKPKRS